MRRWLRDENNKLIRETEDAMMARYKKIKVTPRQLSWLKKIKNLQLSGDWSSTCELHRAIPRDVLRKLIAHDLIKSEINITENGEKWIFIQDMKEIG